MKKIKNENKKDTTGKLVIGVIVQVLLRIGKNMWSVGTRAGVSVCVCVLSCMRVNFDVTTHDLHSS